MRQKVSEIDPETRKLRLAVRDLVYDEFKHTTRKGMILITYEEMTNVFINLLAEFIQYKRKLDPDLLQNEER